MTVKITNPGSTTRAGNPNLASGSFEFYLKNTNIKAYAGINRYLTQRATFVNNLDQSSQPIEHLWMQNLTDYDICFRDKTGTEIARTLLADSIDVINALSEMSTRIDNASGSYSYQQPLQDKRGQWALNGLYWGAPA